LLPASSSAFSAECTVLLLLCSITLLADKPVQPWSVPTRCIDCGHSVFEACLTAYKACGSLPYLITCVRRKMQTEQCVAPGVSYVLNETSRRLMLLCCVENEEAQHTGQDCRIARTALKARARRNRQQGDQFAAKHRQHHASHAPTTQLSTEI
jgi:hypothetical protein